MNPTFSILTAAYNAAGTISETVASVLAQSFESWELIIVDDGSTDSTQAVAMAAAQGDSRVHILREANAGTAAARNRAFAHATGEWLVLLDADDMLEAGYLASQSEFMREHPGRDIYSCNAWMLLRDGSRTLFWRSRAHQRPMELTAEDQIAESSILPMTVMSRAVWRITGGFRDLHSEDYDFWLRALLGGATHAYNPEVLAVYRRQEGSKTTALVKEAESFLWILEDIAGRSDLTDRRRELLRTAIRRARARVDRRRLEERLLSGEYQGARGAYWRARGAFPDRTKFLLGLALIWASPRTYARIKIRRMI